MSMGAVASLCGDHSVYDIVAFLKQRCIWAALNIRISWGLTMYNRHLLCCILR